MIRKVVPADLGEKLKAMAVVHLYWDIDYALLHKTIVEEIDTFEQCIEYIFHYLDRLEAKDE